MVPINDTIQSVTGYLRSITDLGIAFVMTFVVIDVLFPGTTGLVANIGEIVGQFSQQGLVGLIALLLFLVVFKK